MKIFRYRYLSLALLLLFIAFPAYAQCVGLTGCASDNAIQRFIVVILPPIFLSIAGGASVLFVVWGGAQMLFNLGDDAMMTNGRQSVINGLVGFVVVLAAQFIVSYVANRAGAGGIGASINPIVDLMTLGVNVILSLLNIVFVAVCVYAGIRMVIARGESDQFNKAKTALIGAVTGAIVINIAYAVVSAMINAVNLGI